MSLFGTTRAPRQIIVGAGHRHALSRYASKLGSRALICTDERMGQDAVLREMVDALAAAGVQTRVFDATLPEVPMESIEGALKMGRAFAPDLVIGLGGGSCLDQAKVTALLLTHGGKAQDYYGEFKAPGPILPMIALPTTAGTGSEVTPVAVVSDPEKTLKVGIASPELIPLLAICDPELTLTCPPGLTASAGADAMTHAIEAFMAAPREPTSELTYSHVFLGKNAFSDMYALQAIAHIARSLERAVNHGQDDIAARESMMWASMLAGLAFGTAGTAAAHALQYPVGALTHTAHGLGVACLLPYVMEFNSPVCRASLLQIADAMNLPPGGSDEDRAWAAIDAVEALFLRIGIPKTIQELGLAPDQLDWAAEQAMGAARLVKNNPRPLDVAAMGHILRAAQTGDRHVLRQLPV